MAHHPHIYELDELRRNDPDLPTRFSIDLGKLQSGEADYTVDALVDCLDGEYNCGSLVARFHYMFTIASP